MQAATEMILSSADADTVLHQILLIVRNYFGVSTCAVMLVDADKQDLFVRAQNGYTIAPRRYRIGVDGVTGRCAAQRIPVHVPDVTKDPAYICVDSTVRSEIALPLIVRDELIGVLDVESDKEDYFSDEMIGVLALFASQAAVALENARLYQVERRRSRQIEFVNLIARASSSAAGIEQLMSILSELLADMFEGSLVSVLLRGRSGSLEMIAHVGGEMPPLAPFVESARNGSIAEALRVRLAVAVGDAKQRAANSAWRSCLEGTQSELAAPLSSLGETIGVIVISHPAPAAFSPEDRSIAQAAADVCATAIRNVQLSEELRRIANTDSLTGMYNQRYFHVALAQEINRSRRYNKPFSVLMFDVRDFRAINAQHGFDAGDDLLRSISHLLTTSVRTMDTICRYNGDRFTLILPEIQGAQVDSVRGKIIEGLAELGKAQAGGRPLQAIFTTAHFPEDGANELALIRRLVEKLEQEKGRNGP